MDTILSRAGQQAWHRDQVDLLAAIPHEHPAWPAAFREKRWPEILRHVQEARGCLSPTLKQKPRPQDPENEGGVAPQ